MPIAYIDPGDGSSQPVYGESWNVFKDDQGQLWRVPPGDLRGSWQLCLKGTGIDKYWPVEKVDALPIAKPLTDKEREAIEAYNRENHLPWGQRHNVRYPRGCDVYGRH